MATTDLTNRELVDRTNVNATRIPLNRTFVDRGGSERTRNILLETLGKDTLKTPSLYLQSVTSQMGKETPVNTNAVLGIYHAGANYLAKTGERFKGNYGQLRDHVPKVQRESTDYLFNNPPTQARYLIPEFHKVLAANPQLMLPADHMEQTKFDDLKLNHLIPPFELHSFLNRRALESESEPLPAKRQRTGALVTQAPLMAPKPQGLNGLPMPAPLGNAVPGGTTRSSTADVTPTPQQLSNASASASGANGYWDSLFNDMQKDWRTLVQPSSAAPLAASAQSTVPPIANRLPTLPGNPSVPTVLQGPAPTVARSHLNGEQNQISSQQAPSQFPDIDASIAQHLDVIRRNEALASQVTSGNPQSHPSLLPPMVQAPDHRSSGNASSNPGSMANSTAPQPRDWNRDPLALIDHLPVVEPGASMSTSTLSPLPTFNQPAPSNQPVPFNQSSTFNDLANPAVATAPTGQLSNVWAQPTVAQAWNGGSTNAPQLMNLNQAYPQPLNQPQAPSQALVTMPGMYPTANSQFPTNFSNNPPFNPSFAPDPLAPSNSFHDYSQLLHQPQSQQPQSQQPQPQQNMAAPAFYSSMPMNSYSAQQINQYNGPTSNYFAMPATNYSFMPGNSMPTAMGTSAMPAAPANGAGGAGGAGGMQGTGAPSAYPYPW